MVNENVIASVDKVIAFESMGRREFLNCKLIYDQTLEQQKRELLIQDPEAYEKMKELEKDLLVKFKVYTFARGWTCDELILNKHANGYLNAHNLLSDFRYKHGFRFLSLADYLFRSMSPSLNDHPAHKRCKKPKYSRKKPGPYPKAGPSHFSKVPMDKTTPLNVSPQQTRVNKCKC